MQNMRAFKTVCPLRNDLHLDITTAIKVTRKPVWVTHEVFDQQDFFNVAHELIVVLHACTYETLLGTRC